MRNNNSTFKATWNFTCRFVVSFLLITVFWSQRSEATTYQIGTGTGTNSNLPIYTCYGYNYSQQIYTAAELNAAGAFGSQIISQIRFFYSSGGTGYTTWPSWTVYVGNTGLASIPSTSGWVPVGSMTQVFSGNIPTPVAGTWLTLNLSTPFTWDGSSNLVVAVDENTPSYSCTAAWGSFTATAATYRAIEYYSDGTNPNPVSPPTANYSNTTTRSRIQFEMVGAIACSGMPSAGTAVSSSNPACASTAITISLSGATSGTGLTYQWQSSAAGCGSFSNIPGATLSSYTIAQTVATCYRCVVTCTNSGLSATSGSVSVTQNPFTNCYCANTNTTNTTYHIANVNTSGGITNFNNTTGFGVGGYTNYSSTFSATQLQGSTVNYSVSTGPSGYTYGIGIWIDWNQNGSFADAGEQIVVTGSYVTSTSGTITVPLTAVAGTTRMRVVANYLSTLPTACTGTAYTECEDYAFTVIAPNPCVGTPTPGNTLSTLTTVCPNQNFTLSLQNTPLTTGNTYQWQSGTSSTGPWTNIGAPGGCNYIFRMVDSYGDGWNGATMQVRQGTTVIATIGATFTTGYQLDIPLTLNASTSYNLYYQASGSWPSEVGIQILNESNTTIYSLGYGGGIAGSTLHTWTTSPCPGPSAGPTLTTSQTSAKWYRAIVTCAGNNGPSNPIQVNMAASYICLAYCASGATSTADEEIYSITVNGASTPAAYSGVNGCATPAPGPGSLIRQYSNFKTLGPLTSAMAGAVVPFTINEDECDGATYYPFGTGIWIDWNQNGTFTDAGEAVFIESATAYGPRNVTGSFTVPLTAIPGTTVMRITVAEGYAGSSLTPCLSYGYGETEDWAFTVILPPPCSGTPAPGNTNTTHTAACPTDVFTLSLQNNPVVSGLTYQWQSGTSSTGPWTNIGPTGGCSYIFRLMDSFGDGWNGATMQVRQGTTVIATLGGSFTTGYQVDVPVSLNASTSYNLYYTGAGGWPSEVGIQILNEASTTIYSLGYGGGSAGTTLHTWTTNACPGPVAGPTIALTQSTAKWYRALVTCAGNTGISNPVFVATAVCYCTTPPYSLGSGCGVLNYINNVTFAGINNTSGCAVSPFYQYFGSQNANVVQTGVYPLSISSPAGGANFQLFKVYIDYNDNGSFEDAGEMVFTSGFSSTSINLATGTIQIPLSAPLGTHRLRVRSTNPLNTNIDANSCSDDGYYGEVEDYNIIVGAAPPCSGIPGPGMTKASSPLACPTTSIILSLQYPIGGLGVTYQWQSSPTIGFASPTNLGTATTQSVTQTSTTYYRCLVTCSGNTGISTPVLVTSTTACYCTNPSNTDGCALGLYINNVTFGSINNTSGCYNPLPYNTPFYTFFPITANVLPGFTYPFSASTPTNITPYYHFFRVWIDYNDNGSFDDLGETVLSSAAGATVNTNVLTGNITIPSAGPFGPHLMRIRSSNTSSGAGTNSCSDVSAGGETEDYIVNIIPPAPITNSPVCEGNTITMQAPSTGTAYSWTGPNGFTSTDYDPEITLAELSDAGTYTVVVTTPGGTYSAAGAIVVNPAPEVSASAPAAFCEGTQNLQLSSIAPTATSWAWSGPGGYTSTDQNPLRSPSTFNMTGNYEVVVTDANGCKDSVTVPVTVYALPPVNAIPIGSSHLCTGQQTTLYVDGAGATGTYVWSTSETGDNIIISTGGSYEVTGTDNNGCINTDMVVITESAPPPAPVIVALGDVNLCSSDGGGTYSSVTLHTTNYSSDLFWSTGIDVTQDIVVYYIDNFNVTYTDGLGCASTSNTISTIPNLTSTAPVDAQITSDAPGNITCAVPVTLTLADGTDPLGSGFLGTGAQWVWYDDAGCGANQVGTGTSIMITPPAAPGPHNYYVRSEGGPCGTTACATIVITVKDPSLDPTSASASVSTLCSGDQTILSVTGGTLGTGAQWKWYAGSCGGTLVGIGASVTVNTAVTTTYYVRAEGDCNNSVCVSTTVTVNSLSTDPTTATSNAPVNGICIGGSVTLSVSGGTLGDNSTWEWYEDACGGTWVGSGSSINVTPAFDGLHSYYVRAEGPCNTTNCAAVSVLVGTYSVEATSITSSVVGNSICVGNNIILTANGGFLGTVADWKWYSGSCGGAAAGTGSSITVNPAVSTTYYVRAEGSCNNTICTSVVVNVSTVAPIHPPTITTAPNGICSGNGSTVAANPVAGATFYSWSGPNGTTFDGGNPSPYVTTSNSVQVNFGNLPNGVSGYDICVFAGNGCGNTVTKCRYIRGRVQTAQSITGNASSCPNTTSAYSITSLPGADSYTWTVTGDATINGGGTTLTTTSTTINVNFLSGWTIGTLSVYGSMNCGYNGPAKTITIISTPVVPGVMSGPTLVCPNGTYTYSIAPVAGAVSYNWSTNVPGAILAGTGTSRSITYPSVIPAGSTVSVTATGSCGTSAPRVKNIATGLANAPGTISGPAMGQCGQTGVGYSILPVAGATSYFWSATNGATVSGLNNITSVNIDFPAAFTTSSVSVVAVNSCGNSAPTTKLVTGAPGSPGAISGTGAVCLYAVETYSIVGSTGATQYVWTSPSGSQIMSGQNSPSIEVYFFDNTGGNVSVYAANACGSSSTVNLAVSVVCRLAQVSQGALIDATLYPNPTIGTTTLKFETITAGDYKVSVIDMTGQVMQSKSVNAIAGLNLHELDLSTYAKGLYMVRLEREGEGMQMLRVTVE